MTKKVPKPKANVPVEHGVNASEKHRGLLPPWQKGQSGNPKGKPKGTRTKISEDFLRDLHEAWETNGKEALRVIATEKHADFVKVVAGLLPKEVQIKDELSEFTDEQLAALAALIGTLASDAPGVEGENSERAGPQTLQ
jgi:hypothetical protein